jgi:hypothetical protein
MCCHPTAKRKSLLNSLSVSTLNDPRSEQQKVQNEESATGENVPVKAMQAYREMKVGILSCVEIAPHPPSPALKHVGYHSWLCARNVKEKLIHAFFPVGG